YNQLTKNLGEYKKNKLLKKETIELFKPFTDSLNTIFREYYNKEIDKANLGYALKYKKTIKSIILYDNDTLDTIFLNKNGESYFLFGESFPDKEGNVISKGRWFTEHDVEDDSSGRIIKTEL
ncbi:hypothetical protein J9332_37995, partial [Aquimarina celericrescens]|nr:hypothetical protein [Aquimarina celericrescens]